MKLIIDINDNEYIGIKEYPNNITSYPVTIHIYDAIRNGTPLEEELEKIKTEIEELKKEWDKFDDWRKKDGLFYAYKIVEKHIEELKGENK